MLKRKKLRHNEYYDMQHCFDNLYSQSVDGQNFYELMKLINSKIQNMVFVPIYAQRHKTNLCFSQDVCNYTAEGR